MFFLCVNRSGGFQFCKIKNSSLICSILLVVEPDAATKLCSLYFREKQHKRLSSPVPCDNYKLASNLSVNVIKSGLVSHTYHVRQPSPWLVSVLRPTLSLLFNVNRTRGSVAPRVFVFPTSTLYKARAPRHNNGPGFSTSSLAKLSNEVANVTNILNSPHYSELYCTLKEKESGAPLDAAG